MDRKKIDNKYKWDLSLIYKTEEEFNKDIKLLKNMVNDFKKYENHTMDSANLLYESNKLYNDIIRLSNKIYTLSNIDLISACSQVLAEKYKSLYMNFTHFLQKPQNDILCLAV